MAYKRTIIIGRQNYSARVNSCTFDWGREGGCLNASLVIEDVPFDQFAGIEIGELVDIRYSTDIGSRWWYGFVAELQTDLNGGLRVSCVGGRVKVGEIYPLGRFGTNVDMAAPTGLTYLVTEVGGQLAAATYTYRVSAIDDTGETLPSSTVAAVVAGSTGKVDLTWDKVEGASGYRVYRGTANPFTYWETSETDFTDDGTSSGTSIAAVPSSDTAESPTISSAFTDDVITHLLNTYLPDDLDVGDITAGDEFELDDYDLGDGSASLAEVLDALVDIVGDCVWGVDEQGDVFFVPLSTSWDYDFIIGKDGQRTNNVSSATRKRSRDGVTAVRIVAEDEANDPAKESALNSEVDPGDDWPSPKTLSGKSWWRGANYRFTSKVTTSTPTISAASSFFTSAYSGDVQTAVQLAPELAAIKRTAMKFNGTSYEIRAPYTEAVLARQLAGINERIRTIQGLRNRNAADMENMTRKNAVTRYLPGVKSPALAKIAATNFTLKYKPVPDSWSVVVENITDLIKPGQHMIRIVTQSGDKYDLVVQSVSYDFGDIPTASITCGDPEYDEEKEVEDTKKATRRITSRIVNPGKWIPYGGVDA